MSFPTRSPRRPTRRAIVIQGSDEGKQDVFEFLERTVGTVEIEEGERIFAQLYQQGFGAEKPFHTIDFDPTEDALEKIAEELVEAAEEDITGVGDGKIVYTVMLANHNGRQNFSLIISSGRDLPNGDQDFEMIGAPTAKNMIQMQMQHNKMLMDVIVGNHLEMSRFTQKIVKEQSETIARLQSERWNNIELAEQLVTHKHERDLRNREIERSEDRKDQVAGTLIAGLPVIINKLASKHLGQNIIPERTTSIENMLVGIFSQFTEQDLQKVATTGVVQLSAPQLIAFMEVFKAIHEKLEQEKKNPMGVADSQQQSQVHDAEFISANGSGKNTQ